MLCPPLWLAAEGTQATFDWSKVPSRFLFLTLRQGDSHSKTDQYT
jgi:hypothetical protein